MIMGERVYTTLKHVFFLDFKANMEGSSSGISWIFCQKQLYMHSSIKTGNQAIVRRYIEVIHIHTIWTIWVGKPVKPKPQLSSSCWATIVPFPQPASSNVDSAPLTSACRAASSTTLTYLDFFFRAKFYVQEKALESMLGDGQSLNHLSVKLYKSIYTIARINEITWVF